MVVILINRFIGIDQINSSRILNLGQKRAIMGIWVGLNLELKERLKDSRPTESSAQSKQLSNREH